MSVAVAEKKRWTVEEYLAMERESPDKHDCEGTVLIDDLYLGI